jgi:ABC-type branched-subunit amino acid transport system substrate-binding protein
MALDTLEKMGLDAYVKLYDTRSDSATCLAALEDMSKSQWDLVIGPLFHGPAELAAKWAKDNRVPILMSTPTSPLILKMNPYVHTAIPSDQRMMEALAQHLASKHAKDNIILVKSGNAEDDKNYEFFRNKINSLLGAGAYRRTVKEISGAPALSSAYVAGIKNVYVMLGKNKQSVMSFWTAFSSFQVRHSDGNNPNILLYGMREWEDWKEMTAEQKSLVNFHYASATSWMPKSEAFQNFAKQYRARFLAEPEKLTVQGYDAVHFFIRSNFLKNMKGYNAVINSFNYVSTGDGHGMENSTVFIMKYADSELMIFNRVQ